MTTKEYYKKYSDRFHDALGTNRYFVVIVDELTLEFETELRREIDSKGLTDSSQEGLNIHKDYIKKWNQLCRMFKKYDGWSPISPVVGPYWTR